MQGSGAHNPWSPLDVHRIFSNNPPPPQMSIHPLGQNIRQAPPSPPLAQHFLLMEGIQRKAVSIATLLITLCVNCTEMRLTYA